MSNHSTTTRMGDALDRARREWRRQLSEEARVMSPLPAAPPRWTIAFSREAGINVAAVAGPLAEQLGWTVYDRELVDRISKESGLQAELVESLDEVPARRFHSFVERLLGRADINVDRYSRSLAETVFALAARGDCVLIGRGAAVALPAESTLAVLLVAPLSARIDSVRAVRGVSEAEARREIERIDAERREFVQARFHKNPDDPHLYDLVLNVARLAPTQCAAVISEALRQLQASPGR